MAVTQVYCRTRFIGFHYWDKAPAELDYLQGSHRHEFHVEVAVLVTHSDRAVEFHTLRAFVDKWLQGNHSSYPQPFAYSCEQIAQLIAEAVSKGTMWTVAYVDVSEDGENGARYIP